jgi:hypothetical protein
LESENIFDIRFFAAESNVSRKVLSISENLLTGKMSLNSVPTISTAITEFSV